MNTVKFSQDIQFITRKIKTLIRLQKIKNAQGNMRIYHTRMYYDLSFHASIKHTPAHYQ